MEELPVSLRDPLQDLRGFGVLERGFGFKTEGFSGLGVRDFALRVRDYL